MIYDYMIVGQGIAGTMLSYSLLKRNKKILVIDQPFSSTSMVIQHAMYSPIIFKRFTKAWMADKLLSEMVIAYRELENKLTISFLHEKNILRVLASEEEKKLWLNKCVEESYWDYLDDDIINEYSSLIEAPFGYGRVKNAGSINLIYLISTFRNYLRENEILIERQILYDDIKINEYEVAINNYTAKMIIFCEGYFSLNNPFFKNMPFLLSKGELLKVRIKNFPEEYILSSAVNLTPLGNEEFKISSTYAWDDLNTKPTEKARKELLLKLIKFVKSDIEILDHYAGIRPTIKDRRPLIGIHPDIPQIGIFNGMGTKGVMLAPYFAEHFVNHLENNADLMPEVYAYRVEENENKGQ
jgi:glycine/D-amino acid oxidase-like deaminating enzyme